MQVNLFIYIVTPQYKKFSNNVAYIYLHWLFNVP